MIEESDGIPLLCTSNDSSNYKLNTVSTGQGMKELETA